MSRTSGQEKLLLNTEDKKQREKKSSICKKQRSSSGMLCRRALQQRFRRSREAIPSLRFPEEGCFWALRKNRNKIPGICSRYLQATHRCQFITET
ncbi:hypothetical protein CEXT_199851 [Caerostris extrusa]|uniref:Uncharacterized protein n=1 Tax=Caerostris extrusa TaxID=172846 RepID=A0AAV4S503_CAEEX|nr:hypothetical protein CEXT_199851 [Caerostris extrusa]